jgi:histidine triad (HIT) family protein
VRGGCPFCDWDGPVLFEWGSAFVIEPLNPVVPGHALAIPRRHVPSADPLPFVTGPTFATAVMYARHAGLASYNLISSVGAPATQTVFHLHVHVVPRREGDGLALPWTGQGALQAARAFVEMERANPLDWNYGPTADAFDRLRDALRRDE